MMEEEGIVEGQEEFVEEGNEEPRGPGESPLDEGLKRLAEAMGGEAES